MGEELEYKVAASPAELRALLAAGPYVEHQGTWRWLSALAEREILDTALALITANGWNPAEVNGKELLRSVQGQIGGDSLLPSLEALRKGLRSVAKATTAGGERAKICGEATDGVAEAAAATTLATIDNSNDNLIRLD